MDGAADTAGVTPRVASYHTDGSLSSTEGAGARGGDARVAARGPCAPCGFPGGPHGGPRPRQPTPHPAPLAPPRPPPAPPPVREWRIREAVDTPLYAERVRLAMRLGSAL